ncbi:hypothetical protein OAQ15_01885 [Flavobacteriaceae bacterium]|nr:hypothetical protein [Flavobacteriaceae bacterium]
MKIKERLIGIATGIILTSIGMFSFTLFFSEEKVLDSLYLLYTQKKLGGLMSIGALLNLPVFFVFINQYRYDRAYGLVSFLLVLVVIIGLLKYI